MVGLFVLLQLLLAIFYFNYQLNVSTSLEKNEYFRNRFIYEEFHKIKQCPEAPGLNKHES